MEKRFELTIQEILDKQFHIDLKGYCANEVDMFLDQVIKDYQSYEENIANLGRNLKDYDDENQRLKKRINDLEVALQGRQVVSDAQVDHLDIVKRLSRLENEVFKNK